jgi:hypothetical protein
MFVGSGSAFGIVIDPLSLTELQGLIPTEMVGPSTGGPTIGNGVEGVDGQVFWADADGVVSDDDDPIVPNEVFDLILGPCTVNDVNYNPGAGEPTATPDIDAMLITVTFDVSGASAAGGVPLLPITLSETGGAMGTLGISDFDELSVLGFQSGGGGDSFNPANDDLVGAFLITDTDFNAGVDTDIGDFVLTPGAGFDSDYENLYRIDLFGVDLDYEYTSPPRGGEIIAGASNSAGGYLVPEPGSMAIIGSLLVGFALKKPLKLRRK